VTSLLDTLSIEGSTALLLAESLIHNRGGCLQWMWNRTFQWMSSQGFVKLHLENEFSFDCCEQFS
jgi:hypothetical protein